MSAEGRSATRPADSATAARDPQPAESTDADRRDLLGLLLGLVLGGKIERLADIRLQYLPLLFVAVIIRFGTEALLG